MFYVPLRGKGLPIAPLFVSFFCPVLCKNTYVELTKNKTKYNELVSYVIGRGVQWDLSKLQI